MSTPAPRRVRERRIAEERGSGIIISKGAATTATVTIQEAQAQLLELIHGLAPGEEIVVTENDQPVSRILPTTAPPQRAPRQLGTLKGMVRFTTPDLDGPREDFKEYMGSTIRTRRPIHGRIELSGGRVDPGQGGES